MKVVITGAAGFLGSRLADALLKLNSELSVTELVLVDTILPPSRKDPRVITLALDITTPEAARKLVDTDTDVLFHLAAVVSGHAEEDFDLGMKVNFNATRSLLEAARHRATKLRFVFTSTVGVFGGDLPPIITDQTAATPQNSYGIAKTMSELLINDYSRRGFVDGRVVRLPTVSIRAGTANRAVTSFASGIIREPLNGKVAICPVPPDQELWLSSPGSVVYNLIHAATLLSSELEKWRVINLPGISVTVRKMISSLCEVSGSKVAELVRYEHDETISAMVGSFPSRFDNSRALRLGFRVDSNFTDVIRSYILEDLKQVSFGF